MRKLKILEGMGNTILKLGLLLIINLFFNYN